MNPVLIFGLCLVSIGLAVGTISRISRLEKKMGEYLDNED